MEKKIVKSAISLNENCNWNQRTYIDPDFTRYLQLHSGKGLPRVWKFTWSLQETKIIKTLLKLWTIPPMINLYTCHLCHSQCNDIFRHIACSCPSFSTNRDQFWDDITNFDLCVCTELCGLGEEDLYIRMLGKTPVYPLHEHEQKKLILICGNYLIKIFAIYNRAWVIRNNN